MTIRTRTIAIELCLFYSLGSTTCTLVTDTVIFFLAFYFLVEYWWWKVWKGGVNSLYTLHERS